MFRSPHSTAFACPFKIVIFQGSSGRFKSGPGFLARSLLPGSTGLDAWSWWINSMVVLLLPGLAYVQTVVQNTDAQDIQIYRAALLSRRLAPLTKPFFSRFNCGAVSAAVLARSRTWSCPRSDNSQSTKWRTYSLPNSPCTHKWRSTWSYHPEPNALFRSKLRFPPLKRRFRNSDFTVPETWTTSAEKRSQLPPSGYHLPF